MSMKRTVLTFGFISGAVSALLMIGTCLVIDRIGFDKGFLVGYTAIVASLLPVFFGIRAYREQAGGALTFGRGFTVGILITLISCVCYVAAWQVIYFNFWPDFADQWTAYTIDQARASGATAEAIEQTRRQMAQFKEMYDKPLANAALTFVEPFPIGLLVTVISAGVLRRRAVKA